MNCGGVKIMKLNSFKPTEIKYTSLPCFKQQIAILIFLLFVMSTRNRQCLIGNYCNITSRYYV